jgi:hypothetical protein
VEPPIKVVHGLVAIGDPIERQGGELGAAVGRIANRGPNLNRPVPHERTQCIVHSTASLDVANVTPQAQDVHSGDCDWLEKAHDRSRVGELLHDWQGLLPLDPLRSASPQPLEHIGAGLKGHTPQRAA